MTHNAYPEINIEVPDSLCSTIPKESGIPTKDNSIAEITQLCNVGRINHVAYSSQPHNRHPTHQKKDYINKTAPLSFEELEEKFTNLRKENVKLKNELNALQSEHSVCAQMYDQLKCSMQDQISQLKEHFNKLSKRKNANPESQVYRSEVIIREQEMEMLQKELKMQKDMHNSQMKHFIEREEILKSQVNTLLNDYKDCSYPSNPSHDKQYQNEIANVKTKYKLLKEKYIRKGKKLEEYEQLVKLADLKEMKKELYQLQKVNQDLKSTRTKRAKSIASASKKEKENQEEPHRWERVCRIE